MWGLEHNKYNLPYIAINTFFRIYSILHKLKGLLREKKKNSFTKDRNSLRQENLHQGIPPDSFLKIQIVHSTAGFQTAKRLTWGISNKELLAWTAARALPPSLGTTGSSTVASALQPTAALPDLLLYRLTQPHPIITLHCSILVLCPLNCSHLG